MLAMQGVEGNPAAATASVPGSSAQAAGLPQPLAGSTQQPQGGCSTGMMQHLWSQQLLTPAATATALLSDSVCRPHEQEPAQQIASLAHSMPPAPSACEGSQSLPLQQGGISTNSNGLHPQHQQQQLAGQAPALHPRSSPVLQQLQQPALPPGLVVDAVSCYLAVLKAKFTLTDLRSAVLEFMDMVTEGQFTQFVLDSKYSIKSGTALALLPCCPMPGAADYKAAATALRPLAADVYVGLLLEHSTKQADSSVPHAPNVQQLFLPTSNNSNRSTSSSTSSGSGASPPNQTAIKKQKQPANQQQGQHRVSWCPLALLPPHKAVQRPEEAQLQQLVAVPGTKVLKLRLDWKKQKGEQQEAEHRLWEAAAALYLYQQQVQGGADGWDGGPAWAALKQRVQLQAPAPRDAASLAASELRAMPGRLPSDMQCSE